MQNNRLTTSVLIITVIIVLNVLFFLWTDNYTRGTVVWMSYGFGMFAFIVACVSLLLSKPNRSDVSHLTTVLLSLTYFCVQTALSIAVTFYSVVILQAQEVIHKSSFLSEYYALLVFSVYLLLLLFFSVRLVIHYTANKTTTVSLKNQAIQHEYIENNSKRLYRLMQQVTDNDCKKVIKGLYETIRYSANQGGADAQQIEAEINVGIDKLESQIIAKDWAAVVTTVMHLTQLAKIR